MSSINDPEMQLFLAILNGRLTYHQRAVLALLVHVIGTQAPDDEGMQAAAWRFVRCDYAKLLQAYLHPREHTQIREG